MRTSALFGLLVLVAASPAAAQGDPAGYELSLSGSDQALAGRPLALRGVAYRVHGLAELRPLARGRVKARARSEDAAVPEPPWVEVTTDGRGTFLADVPTPDAPSSAATLEVVVGDGRTERSFELPITLTAAVAMDLFTDRRLYEPGETVHVWARLWDLRSRRPIAGATVRFTPDPGGIGAGPREVRTSESGVASLELPVASDAIEGDHVVSARALGVDRSASFRIGTRVFERLFAKVRAPSDAVAPHAAASIAVEVRTPSGAPVRGATVALHVDGRAVGSRQSGPDGVATFDVRAPAYLEHDTGIVGVRATITHPAHGQAIATGSLRLAVPLALNIEAIVPNGGLVPEVPGVMWLVLSDGSGEPPPAGTEVEVRGPAVRGRPERARTDANGIAEVPVRLPRGAATLRPDEGEEIANTTIVVHVPGPLGRTARVQVPVLREARVVPHVASPVVTIGAPIDVTLARRPSAAALPVVVELLSGRTLVTSRVVGPGDGRVRLEVPRGWLGVLLVRARPMVEDGVAEGTGAIDAVLVRPPTPFFPQLEPDRDVYGVRQRARITLRAPATAEPRAWAAILVRDLAAHAGESPFALQWLDGAFEEALIDPQDEAASRLLRTALAAYATADPEPAPAPPLLDALGLPPEEAEEMVDELARGTLRDPFPMADELRRRGVAESYLEVEQLLEGALSEGGLDEVTIGRGAARRFRPDVLENAGEPAVGLGDEPLTIEMLQAADPSFRYETVARRVARRRLVQLAVQLVGYLDPGDEATVGQRMAAREPFERWLPRMVERGVVTPEALLDPWGGRFVLRRTPSPTLTLAVEAAGIELVSPGPDGRAGTTDDVRDPFARAVPAGTPYAVACGEDELLRQLSTLTSAEQILQALLESYRRSAAEVGEEEIGDAMVARASMGSLTGEATGDSFGYGGLGLRGTGRGGGGSGYGTIGLGGIGTIGHGSGAGSFTAAILRIVRERFPATLKFIAELPLDASGRTTFEVPLADAVTTYRVEAIVWTADGFTWSARRDVRVDQDVTVDAPVPENATVGDRIVLPVRVANRAGRERSLVVRLGPPGGAPQERTVRVGAADALEVPMTMVLDRPLEDAVVAVARTPEGEMLDAIRRPIAVRRPMRRVVLERSALGGGTGSLELDVPAGATSLPGSEVRVSVGLALFEEPSATTYAAWADAFDSGAPARARTFEWDGPDAAGIARTIGARWKAPGVTHAQLRDALARLTEVTAPVQGATALGVDVVANVLLGLAPAVPHLATPSRPRGEMEELLRSVRMRAAQGAAELEDAPAVWARVAAALALTAPRRAGAERNARVRELVRRVRAELVEVGEHTWVAADGGLSATAWLAIAELSLGERERAYRLVTTLGRLVASGRTLDDETLAAARVAALMLSSGRAATTVRVIVDGRPRRLTLARGEGRLSIPELGAPGRHTVRVHDLASAAGAPLFVRATTVHGVRWDAARRGTLQIELEGDTPALDERASLQIVVRNRSPRTVVAPSLHVTLFAGAELDEEARGILTRQGAHSVDTALGTVQMTLPPMPPGSMRRVPLPVMPSIGGDLNGLGIAAWPGDRPEDVSVVMPRRIRVARREAAR